MSWEKVRLSEICEINIGKTPSRNISSYWGGNNKWISISDLKGKRYVEDTKENISEKAVKESGIKAIPPNTLLYSFKLSIGKIAITKDYIYSNEAIASLPILDKTKVSLDYLYWAMQTLQLDSVGDKAVMGVTLNKAKLKNLEIPLPPLPIQEKIAAILDKADALRRKDQELLKKYDELAQAIFIDMFGDPVKNENGWEVKRLSELGTVVTGNTPPRANDKNYGDYIEWIKTDNILLEKVYPVKAKEYLSESGSKLGRIVSSNSILVTCIAGSKKSIGNCCLTDRTVAFNQQINAFKNFDQFYKPTFLYRLFKEYQSYIQNSATDGMKKIITKSEFEKLAFIVPSLDLQETFAKKIELIHQLKAQANAVKSEELFQSLLQRAFKGELVR